MANITCNSTASLFQVVFSISFANEYFRLQVLEPTDHNSQEARDYFDSIVDAYFEEGENVEDVSVCLPKDGCYKADVYNLDPDMSKFIFEGNELTKEYSEDTRNLVEFGGGCIPMCSANESLVEMKLNGGDYNEMHWRLEDGVTGDELAGCNNYACVSDLQDAVFERVCVPKKHDCLRFIYGVSLSIYSTSLASFEFKVDGQVVAQQDNAEVFTVVDIGDKCPTCQQNESLFELLLNRQPFFRDPNKPLSFSLIQTNDHSTLLNRTVEVPESDGNRTDKFLQYVRQCVPSQNCFEFTIYVPDTSDSQDFFWEKSPYQLKLDGEFWKNQFFDYSYNGSFNSSIYSDTTNLGHCTKEIACNTDSESLLEVTLETQAGSDDLRYDEIGWFVASAEETDSLFLYVGSIEAGFAMGYHAGSTFKASECFPNDKLVFGVQNDVPDTVAWTVVKDGDQLDCRLEQDYDAGVFSNTIITPLDGSCGESKKLAVGAIAGIAVGASLLGLLLIGIFLRMRSRNGASAAETSTTESKQTPLQADRDNTSVGDLEEIKL